VLNLSKSRFDPGPPPKSLMVRFQPDPKGVKSTSERVDAEGKKSIVVYTAVPGSADASKLELLGVAGTQALTF